MKHKQEQWTSKIGFILAASGSAIGLGAIWKLPYMTGTNGGGAFFIIFLLFTLFLGLPLLLAEFTIGRHTKKEAISAYETLAPNTPWNWIGKLGVFTAFLLLSFYSVVGGWIVIYLIRSTTLNLSGLSTDDFSNIFNETISNPFMAVGAHFLFLLLTIIVVKGGIQKGIERYTKIMMPALFILFIVIVLRSVTLTGSLDGIRFLFIPDFSSVTGETVLMAIGQSFFSLSLGTSIMVTYSSYLKTDESLPKAAGSIVSLSIFISVLAGLAIFPAVFSFGLEPTEGPPLIFIVLPAVFSSIPFGSIFFFIFMLLLLFATLTSAFSLLELVVASVTKNDKNKRERATWKYGLFIFVLGIPSALSYGIIADIEIFGQTFFDSLDFLVSNILIPLGALLIAIFTPFVIKKHVLFEELNKGSSLKRWLFETWYFLLKYIVPIAIIFAFLNLIGII
ncbi:sodium-dependent transporter [Evansella cellulosilytica]|uniref:Sodium:neurotransmitter symporter n=1 Tax=Evansella cellulosilytica (strain ATCC 21833 / DSM 2522 / FERM P-1141 / JCM 9156 / N-4) TaxID=649639 RepID=E6U1X5_EVAC2|nr:sodium-dependent transporter [Evansella cellulosilytica]ADU31622.1 sodium:neurotransmitter symporter [Evansella cellulosilytica DSM 2522]